MGNYDDIIRDSIRRPKYASPEGPFPGVIEEGNIDLEHRPQVMMPDGTVATVYSATYNMDGGSILLPKVSMDGRIMDRAETIAEYRRTGKHLGKFATPEDADRFAEELHKSQDRFYSK